MAPLCIHDENDFFCNEEDSSIASTATDSTSSLSSSGTSNESSPSSPAAPLQTPHARRSVSFSAGAAVHLGAVMNVAEYSDYEKRECWFQVEEMREIRKEVKDTVALMNQNVSIDKSFDDISLSTRGLEGKTRAGKRYRREARVASLSAVFDEQTMQEMDGVNDPVMISMAYCEYTNPMQVAALDRAARYQEEAREIYESSNDAIEELYEAAEQALARAGTTGCGVQDGAAPAKPTIYLLEIEETDDDDEFDAVNNASEDETVRDDGTIGDDDSFRNHANNKYFDDDKDDLLLGLNNNRNNNNNIRPYNIGPFRIRDRFACFLPGAASKTGRSTLMGALRVVHI